MSFLEPVQNVYELGGPVIVILIIVSILTLTLILYKAWQYYEAGIGRDEALEDSLKQWDNGHRSDAAERLSGSSHVMTDVIALGYQIADQDTSRPVVARTGTLEVSPIVVAQLAQAQSSGRLTLSLRGVEEEGILGPLVVTQEDLLGIEEVVEEEKRKCFNRIRRGLSIEIIEIPCIEN